MFLRTFSGGGRIENVYIFIIIVCLSCVHYYKIFTKHNYKYVVMMVLRDSRVNEIRSRDVFICAQSDDVKTVSFTQHLGSVLALPWFGGGCSGQGRYLPAKFNVIDIVIERVC